MNALYHELTGQFTPDEELPKEQDATLAQLELNWKKHPFTAKFHKDISEQINTLIDESISLAASFPQHQNHQQIIHKLVEVDTLRKLKQKYA